MSDALAGRRVLVTGGAGFIGSELVAQLVGAAAEVVVIDNLVTGSRANLASLPAPASRLVEADIREQDTVRALLTDVDTVFHLACLGVRHSIHSPRENHDVNATATLDLLALARAAGVRRFVHVSSSEVYGTARTVPMTEEHPTYPTTVYGASKLAGECYARAFHATYGMATVVVRPFNAFGPRSHHEGDSGEVIPKFLLRSLAGRPMVIFGDGTQSRDFTYVADTARGIIAASLAAGAVGQTVNIGSGEAVTISALAERVARVAGRSDARVEHDVPRPGDVLHLRAGVEKARTLLGFTPRVSLDDGLDRLLAWYRSLDATPDDLLQNERARNWEVPAP
jgi:UDP-glucose 4-epimerase